MAIGKRPNLYSFKKRKNGKEAEKSLPATHSEIKKFLSNAQIQYNFKIVNLHILKL